MDYVLVIVTFIDQILKKAHNGTLKYTSRDNHKGVESRRGDLEILGYNMIEWSGGILPWQHLCKKNAEKKILRTKFQKVK